MRNCINSKGTAIRYGKTTNNKQRFRCKACGKTFLERYTYQAYRHTNRDIVRCLKEGLGIRSMARLLEISPATVLKKILVISETIVKPLVSFGKAYEVDEMRVFIKRKNCLFWIVYALQKDTKIVADFAIGKRTNITLARVVDTLILSKAGKIFTDKLPNYAFIIPPNIHKTTRFGTNDIERMNLTLRTHLKRLNRRTICYSRSLQMLIACLKIYFWG